MSKFLSTTTPESGLPPCVREEIGSSPSSGHCTVTELNSSDESEDMMSDTELPRNTLSDDEETKLQEIYGKITVKMKEIASLHKERGASLLMLMLLSESFVKQKQEKR